MKALLFAISLAALFWFLMFFPGLGLELNFWGVMTAASLTLTALAIFFGGLPQLRADWRELALGVGIAVVLWGVFWAGDKLSQLMFNFARPQVDMIYGIKDGTSPTLIGVLLLCIIGPGEEVFWRGYVQRRLCELFASRQQGVDMQRSNEKAAVQQRAQNWAFVAATAAYTFIHVSSLNFMLVMAALVCGIAWGALYRFMPKHFTAIVLSHAIWDAAAFVWFPF